MATAADVNDHALAAFLSDRKRSRHLDPFLAQDSSVADAARLLGVSAQRMHYWTRQLVRLNLIEQVRTEASGRQRTRIYRSVADSFNVPLELLPTSDVETLGLHFAPIWHSFLRSVAVAGRKYAAGWCVRYSRSEEQAAFHIVPTAPPQPNLPFMNDWARLRLTRSQAQSLRHELDSLLQQYLTAPAEPGAREFIAHMALVEATAEE